MYFRAFLLQNTNYGRVEAAAETDLSLLTVAEQVVSEIEHLGKAAVEFVEMIYYVETHKVGKRLYRDKSKHTLSDVRKN